MASDRQSWIDVAKGVAIACVVIGHMSVPDAIRKFVFSFHMPLFFIVAGYLQKDVPFSKAICSRVNRLVFPYIIYGLPSLIVATAAGYDFAITLGSLVKGNGIYTTWFLSSLFCASSVGCLILRLVRSLAVKMLLALVVIVIGQAVPFFQHSHFLSSHTWPSALAFWLFGNCLAQAGLLDRIRQMSFHSRVFVFVLLFLIGTAYLLNISVSIGDGRIGNPIIFYPSATAWSMLLMIVCVSFPLHAPLLEFMGRNSLVLMVWHMLIPALTCTLYGVILGGTAVGWAKVALRILNLSILSIIVVVVDRYAPCLSGRKKWISG